MDDQVKARLIGATVLVALAVALVPELLSGPKRAGAPAAEEGRRTRSHTIDLVAPTPTSVQGEAPAAASGREPSRLPVAEESTDAPGTVAESTKAGDRVETPGVSSASPPTGTAAPPVATPVVRSPTPTEPKAAPASRTLVDELKPAASTTGRFAVQVGAFGSADAARRLVAQLQKDGLAAYVAPLQRDGKTLHRVRVGPQPERAEAERTAARLKARGLPATVVAAN